MLFSSDKGVIYAGFVEPGTVLYAGFVGQETVINASFLGKETVINASFLLFFSFFSDKRLSLMLVCPRTRDCH